MDVIYNYVENKNGREKSFGHNGFIITIINLGIVGFLCGMYDPSTKAKAVKKISLHEKELLEWIDPFKWKELMLKQVKEMGVCCSPIFGQLEMRMHCTPTAQEKEYFKLLGYDK